MLVIYYLYFFVTLKHDVSFALGGCDFTATPLLKTKRGKDARREREREIERIDGRGDEEKEREREKIEFSTSEFKFRQ